MGPDDPKVACAEVVVNYLYWEAPGLPPSDVHDQLLPPASVGPQARPAHFTW